MREFTTRLDRGFRHTVFSNFYAARVSFDGIEYPTVEHAYQSAKTLKIDERLWILGADRPGEAKRRGRQVHLRADWDDVKLDVMRSLLRQKFARGDARAQLLATGDDRLVEGNDWHDEFWGVCRCPRHGVGLNWLGKLLMEIRSEAQSR